MNYVYADVVRNGDDAMEEEPKFQVVRHKKNRHHNYRPNTNSSRFNGGSQNNRYNGGSRYNHPNGNQRLNHQNSNSRFNNANMNRGRRHKEDRVKARMLCSLFNPARSELMIL